MAIAFDAASGSFANAVPGAASLTFSHTCTGSNLILWVYVATGSANDTTTCTYNGVSMTPLPGATSVGSPAGYREILFFLLGPATGAHNVVATLGTGSNLICAASASYTGALQSGVPDATPVTKAISGNDSASITPTADNCWAVMGYGGSSTGGCSAGTGSTQRGSTQTCDFGQAAIFDNGPISPAASTSMGIVTSFGGAVILATFAPAGGGGSTYPSAIINNPVRG